MTNFYPYYINTGLFKGFNPMLGTFVPMLRTDYVVRRMYQAILAEEKEVYIPSIIELMKDIFLTLLPRSLANMIAHELVGRGMDSFTGR